MNHIPHRPPGFAPADVVNINRRVLADMIGRARQMGEGWRIPVLQAAYQGLVNLYTVQGGAPVPSRLFKLQHPTIVIVADDIPEATGPGRWPQARKILRWANGVILHGTGGAAQHSVIAVEMALALGRVVQIEMEARQHEAWLALALPHRPRLALLNIMPPPGGQHPTQGAPRGETVQ